MARLMARGYSITAAVQYKYILGRDSDIISQKPHAVHTTYVDPLLPSTSQLPGYSSRDV